MIPLTAEQLADVVGGFLLDDDTGTAGVDDVVIDSRRAQPGALFVALPGAHTDGHAHLADAAARGASGCLVAEQRVLASDGEPEVVLPAGLATIVVDDPADALLALGRWVRETVDPRVVAITGSSGKTSTKDLIATAAGAGRAVVANDGSYNNDLGVPLTCCKLRFTSEVLVAEVGARGIGHVASLAELLAPDIAVVTTISGAHLELFGDLDTVALAKGELVEALQPDGMAVLNADDRRVAALADRTSARVVTYGVHADAHWRAEDVRLDALARPTFKVRGQRVSLRMPGEHNVGNALAALAVADLLGVGLNTAATALGTAALSRWRMELVRTRRGVTVLNDAYNANPASMSAALRTLARMGQGGRRWAVLGQMAELGATAREEHDRIGRLAARLGIDGLVVVGNQAGAIGRGAEAEGGHGERFVVEQTEQAVTLLADRLAPGDVVLVKASRAAGLERVAEELVTTFEGPA